MEVREVENRKYAAANRLAKRRRKKIRVAVLLCSVFVLIIAILAVLSATVFFPISSISVTESTLYENSEIIEASGIKIGDKLLGISEKRVRNSVTVKLPYIKNIELKRNLFDNVEIVVSETTDSYCYFFENKYYTADADNKILAVFDEKPQGITELFVGDISGLSVGYTLDIGQENLKLVHDIHAILERSNIKITSLNISDLGAITAVVEGRFSVNFGTVQDIESKTEHLRAMITKIDAENGKEVTGKINLSVWKSDKREGYFEATSIF